LSTERVADGIACGYGNAVLTVRAKLRSTMLFAVIPGLFRDPFFVLYLLYVLYFGFTVALMSSVIDSLVGIEY
jgi:hypothetical protein